MVTLPPANESAVTLRGHLGLVGAVPMRRQVRRRPGCTRGRKPHLHDASRGRGEGLNTYLLYLGSRWATSRVLVNSGKRELARLELAALKTESARLAAREPDNERWRLFLEAILQMQSTSSKTLFQGRTTMSDSVEANAVDLGDFRDGKIFVDKKEAPEHVIGLSLRSAKDANDGQVIGVYGERLRRPGGGAFTEMELRKSLPDLIGRLGILENDKDCSWTSTSRCRHCHRLLDVQKCNIRRANHFCKEAPQWQKATTRSEL